MVILELLQLWGAPISIFPRDGEEVRVQRRREEAMMVWFLVN